MHDTRVARKRTRKFSLQQKLALVEFLKEHPQLVSGKIDSSFRREDARRLWVTVTKIMHEIPGARKNWAQWRKVSFIKHFKDMLKNMFF